MRRYDERVFHTYSLVLLFFEFFACFFQSIHFILIVYIAVDNKLAKCNMDLVKAINNYRKENGLTELEVDDTLCNVAYYHAWNQAVIHNIIT